MATVYFTDVGQLQAQSTKVDPASDVPTNQPIKFVPKPTNGIVDPIPSPVPGLNPEPFFSVPLWPR